MLKYVGITLAILSNYLPASSYGEARVPQKPPIVIITVDVETTDLKSRPIPMLEQIEAVCMDEQPCGVQEMVRLLQAKGYAATFFLNVYEYKEYGEPSLMNIAQWLEESGQDVQLHTHPQWAYDENRNMMYQYTLEEQIRIIKEGKELLQKWTGNPVVAHRAGAYGADKNTLEALIKNAILYDSSLFWGWSNSKINSLELKKNALSMYNSLFEFPVTVYQKNEYPPFFENTLEPISRVRKYDINWFASEIEAEKALEQALDLKMDFIILFLHSFSFIEGYNEAGEKEANMPSIERFKRVLDFISIKELEVYTFREIKQKNMKLAQYLNRPDIIPEISLPIGTIQYLRKRIGINRNNYQAVVLSSGISFVLLIILIISLKKRRYQNG